MESMRRALCVLFLMGACSAALWGQITWYVAGAGLPSGSGSIMDPFGSIQQGVSASTHGDVVLVESGVYAEHLDFMGKAIAVIAEDGAAMTEIVGTVTFENNESPAARLEGFTIRATGGPGIRCGGLQAGVQTSPTIKGCVLDGIGGVGILIQSFGPRILSCEVHNANDGILVIDGLASLDACLIHDNSGAGVRCTDQVSSSSVSLTNCLVYNNAGQGILAGSPNHATVAYCTLTGNVAGMVGDGSATNTISWDNTASPFDGLISKSFCDFEGGTGTNIDADPLFVDATIGDLHLSVFSPCRDAGSFAGAPLTDFEGDPRVVGVASDIGADEYRSDFVLLAATAGGGVGDLDLGVSGIPSGADFVQILASATTAPSGLGTGPVFGLMPDSLLWFTLALPPSSDSALHFPAAANPYAAGAVRVPTGTFSSLIGQTWEAVAVGYQEPSGMVIDLSNYQRLDW